MTVSELRQVKDFLAKWDILQVNPETTILSSKHNNLLVKSHPIQECDYEEVSQILDQHLSFDPQYVCPLLDFEKKAPEDRLTSVRAIYQIDRVTLRDEVVARRLKEEVFTEAQLWILLSSITNSLIYLQDRGVVYGVLSSKKIFVQKKIRLMDPSAFNISPMNASRLSLHSPQIRQNAQNIDFFQSDVYLLGLCMLEAATLTQISSQTTSQQLQQLLAEVQNNYSQDFSHVISYILKEKAEQRPTFENIKEFIQQQIQIKQSHIACAEQLQNDQEDHPSDIVWSTDQDIQVIDILQPDPQEDSKSNQYQIARQKYLYDSSFKSCYRTNCNTKSALRKEAMDSVETDTHKDSRKLNRSNYVNEFKVAKGRNETVSKRHSRVHEIKSRNSQNVKPIKSIVVGYGTNTKQHIYTDPQLMIMLKAQTQRNSRRGKNDNFVKKKGHQASEESVMGLLED